MADTIALFDLDGVCVQPGGYRAAVYQSIDYFFNRFNLPQYIPSREIPAIFESIGITSEWDMIALTIAILFETIAKENPALFASAKDLNLKFPASGENRLEIPYSEKISRLSHYLQHGMSPSDSVYQACRSDPVQSPFPNLARTPILQPLLGHTREIQKSEITRYFQNLVLGDKIFQETYGIPAIVMTESYLKLYDQPLISLPTQRKLKDLVQSGKLAISFMTARPSYQPKEIAEKVEGNTPEAEMAMDLIGFSEYPLLGYGKLRYLASILSADAESFLKPSPIQALAAIAAAITNNEIKSLQWAERLVNCQGNLPPELNEWMEQWLPPYLRLHIFEDSLVGIQSVRSAKRWLEGLGRQVDEYAWGISRDSVKINALLKQGAQVVEDVNAGINRAFPQSQPFS